MGGDPSFKFLGAGSGFISIHAPRVGGDITDVSLCRRPDNFNPRPPCGGRHTHGDCSFCDHDFNPRPPCGGRQRRDVSPPRKTTFQSTPPVWGATRPPSLGICTARTISIHAPRVGGDRSDRRHQGGATNFNPRPPCGGRRPSHILFQLHIDFNPRPPCGGRLSPPGPAQSQSNISIHAPRVGGDLPHSTPSILRCLFQSTPPVWGATRLKL